MKWNAESSRRFDLSYLINQVSRYALHLLRPALQQAWSGTGRDARLAKSTILAVANNARLPRSRKRDSVPRNSRSSRPLRASMPIVSRANRILEAWFVVDVKRVDIDSETRFEAVNVAFIHLSRPIILPSEAAARQITAANLSPERIISRFCAFWKTRNAIAAVLSESLFSREICVDKNSFERRKVKVKFRNGEAVKKRERELRRACFGGVGSHGRHPGLSPCITRGRVADIFLLTNRILVGLNFSSHLAFSVALERELRLAQHRVPLADKYMQRAHSSLPSHRAPSSSSLIRKTSKQAKRHLGR